MDMQIISILIITGIAIISPGPDFAMTLRNSLRYGRTSGLFTALGIACGISVHITYTVFGLSYLLLENVWILNSMKILGACYLAWIGISSFFPKAEGQTETIHSRPQGSLTTITAFKTGFLSNALNPKTALFSSPFSRRSSRQAPRYQLNCFWVSSSPWVIYYGSASSRYF